MTFCHKICHFFKGLSLAKNLMIPPPKNKKGKQNMNINQFTIKSQEAIGKAQEIAQSHQSQTVENFHLLKGMILSDDYLVPNLMKKLGVNLTRLNDALDQVINTQPRSSGSELY